MVVAVKEQQPKKSKLSLFRLGKSSSKSSTPSNPQLVNSFDPQTVPRSYAASAYSSNTYPSAHSTPRQYHRDVTSSSTNRFVNDARQAANDPIAVHYQFPDGTNVPRNYHHVSSPEHQCRSDNQAESQYNRIRSDSLPLEAFIHSTEPAVARPPALERIQTDFSAHRHTRQRSHFSIPDVIVTTCEEGQEQILVEVEIPPNKRRSYMLRDTSEESLRERSYKKSNPGYARSRPAPLIRFDTDEIKGIGSAMMPRSASLGSVTSVSSGAGSPTESTTTTATASSASDASSAKASMAKRSRKPSFPLLFGRKASNAAFELPNSPTTPTSAPSAGYGDAYAQPDGLIFTSHTSSRNIFARAISNSSSSSGLPTPPVTPTSPPKASRKQLKAKAKEELALIKELERVDRLVKQHDDRARRVREKEAERQRKRAEKLAHIDGRESVATNSGAQSGRVKTVFKAGSAGAVGVGRRTSIRAAGAVVGERRGSEPTLTRCISPPAEARVSTPFSIDLSDAERLPFTQPRAAPVPNVATSTAPLVLTKQSTEGRPSLSRESTSPPRPTRPAPPVPEPHTDATKPESNDTTLTEDADETAGWNCRQSFSEFSSGLDGPLPSLINSAVLAAETDERDAKLARRASVQRILALSEAAEGARSHKRTSMVKRRSCTADEGSTRSSAASMRKSFIRTIAHDQGWTVDGPDAQDDGEWEEEQQQPVEVEVEAVLADLRAAQQAGRLKLDDGRTSAPQTHPVQDKETLSQPMLGKMHEPNFRLSLALTPLQLQPLMTDLDRF